MIQKPMFSPQVEWTPPEEFKDLSKYDEIAIDLETKDPDLKTIGSGSVVGRSKIVGIAVAVEGWSGYYPIAHEGGGNMDKNMVLKWFQDVLNTDAVKIFHNAMYDVCFIKAAGLDIAGDIVDSEMDTMNKRCLFVIETQEGPLLEFTEESMSKPIRLLNAGIESETPQYFEQRYSDSGKNEEVLTSFSDDKFILKRI